MRSSTSRDVHVFTDGGIRALIDDYIVAAKRAKKLGTTSSTEALHGYLGTSSVGETRPGEFGGSLENRTRFCASCAGIQAEAPGLKSAFACRRPTSFVQARPNSRARVARPGVPDSYALPYRWGSGCRRRPARDRPERDEGRDRDRTRPRREDVQSRSAALLQPAPDAARAVPAVRRLPAPKIRCSA